MSNYSQLVDLDGLNTVYSHTIDVIDTTRDALNQRIDDLGSVYNIKGTLTWSGLLDLIKAKKGDVYNISDTDPKGIIGANYVCIKEFSSKITNWEEYWDSLSGLTKVANDSEAGIIKTYSTRDEDLEKGLKLDTNNQAYITLRKANNTNYGLVKGATDIPSSLTGTLSKVFIGDGKTTLDGVALTEGAPYVEVPPIEAGGGSNLPVYINSQHKVTAISALNLRGDGEILTIVGGAKAASISGTGTVDSSSTQGALTVVGGIYATGGISADRVFHAVWNDISDAIEVQDSLDVEPGYCYYFDGREYHKTDKYCQKGIVGIHSDTAGDILGRKGRCKELDISIGGFVLAHVDKIYKPGTPLTSTKKGFLTKACLLSRLLHPERIVAIFWKDEPQEEWGPSSGRIKVNSRKWVKIK